MYAQRGAQVCVVGRRKREIEEVELECARNRQSRSLDLFDSIQIVSVGSERVPGTLLLFTLPGGHKPTHQNPT